MYGHWNYPHEIDTSKWFGFIYRIVDNTNGMHYIGKKNFHSVRRRAVKGRVNKKITRSESKWMSYTSSSTHVNEAIVSKGKDKFTFTIIALCESKSSLHYLEVELQIREDVLRSKLPDGTRKYYNKMIANMRFNLPEVTINELTMRNT